MKITCTQENLYQGILQVQGIAVQASPLPILKNIFLEAKKGVLKLKSTNLEIGITTSIRGKIDEEGQITADARLLSSFISLLSQEKVNITTDGKNLIIETSVHKTQINGLAADEFPVIPEVKKENEFKISAQEFKQSLLEVSPASSTDDTRPEINGVYCNIADKIITFAGTDSYRLAEKKLELLDGKQGKEAFIIPLRTIKELIRTITNDNEIISLYKGDNQVLFTYGETEMVTRLIEGEYPNYTQIIPTAYNYTFTIGKEDFINAIKISGLFASIGSNSVTLTLCPSKKELIIFSETNFGEERTTLSVDIEGKEDVRIVFDYRYLLDGLTSILCDEVVFCATSESSPSVLKPKDSAKQFLYIVMPIRQ